MYFCFKVRMEYYQAVSIDIYAESFCNRCIGFIGCFWQEDFARYAEWAGSILLLERDSR